MAKAKKLIIIITIVVFCVLCLAFVSNTNVAYAYSLSNLSEPNSASNPYIIMNADDMDYLSSQVSGGNTLEGNYFKLNNAITLNSAFLPIGNLNNQFKGYFDGNDKTITAAISNSTSYNGIFGAVGLTGTITNLRVNGSISGGNTTASIVGYNVGTVDNCINYASIQAASASVEAIGGIVGINYGTVTDCINLGTVCGNNFVGGIAGKNMTTGNSSSTVNGIINLGNISFIAGSNSNIIGGLVGQNDGIVKNGYNYSLITNSGTGIGSIIGYFSTTASLSGSKNCYNNNAKSAVNVIGINVQSTLPVNYSSYSIYEFLGLRTLTFENAVMSVRAFDIGYGYFPIQTQFVTEEIITDEVRHCLFDSGIGTEVSPFVINNSSQWNLFAANTLIHDYNGVYVNLNCNIAQCAPLSSSNYKFNGIFNGNSKTITLSIADASYAGMFRYIGTNGIVKNLTMAGWVSISGSYAGSIAGLSSGSIQNVTTSARIMAIGYAGGLAGKIDSDGIVSNLENVKNSGSIEGTSYLGGIAGYAINPITSGAIINSGAVQGNNITSGSGFGGIFGQLENGSMISYSNWLNSGVITATKGQYVGGLAGYITNASILGSMNIGLVTGSIYVGGIAGYISGGNLDSVGVVNNIVSANYAGGLVGFFATDASITDSYFSGEFHALINRTIVSANFRILAYSTFTLTLTNVYYNNDRIDAEGITDTSLIIPSSQGTGASYIQLTDIGSSISFSAGNAYWTIADMTLSCGYYPVSANFDVATTTIINNAVRYNYFYSGNGTLATPFVISKAQHLYNLSYLHNNYDGYASLYYLQSANITLDVNFTPIGSVAKPFTGNYDGSYNTISNLVINNTTTSGLFGSLSSAIINKVCIVSGSISGQDNIGSIAGYGITSNISNCYSLVDIISLNASYAGGILGYSDGSTVYGCFNTGRVNGSTNFAGGILGYGNTTSTVSKCFNMGMVTGTGAVAGGIVGSNNGGSIFGCYNSGTVKVTTEAYVGGIVGVSVGTIQKCYTIAKIIYVTTTNSGAIAGSASTLVTNYLSSSFYNSDICALYPFSETTITTNNARTTAQMEASNFVDSFDDVTLYSFEDLIAGKDSHYAPRLSIFINSGNTNIENYSSLSARLRLYGYDDYSTTLWGTVNNPYIINNRTQLATLSSLSATYTYAGCYFELANDIDMRVGGITTNFSPIGSYTDSLTYHAFNGVFDGLGHTLQHLYISSVANYVGLFGMLGIDASVKNLIIDENSTITTTGNFVGSFVGRNNSENGVVDRCVSYASVTGVSNVGGIVGFTYNNTEITNCLFDGTITGTTYVYGVVGISTNSSSNVTTTNSWYVVDIEEGYFNNGYNSTLFVDKNGEVTVTIDTLATNEEFISFTLVPLDINYTGFYMDSNDNIVSSNYVYYSINNTTLTSIYARFTIPVSAEIIGGAGIIEIIGTGKYYCGQNVALKVNFLTYGYFINIFDLGNGTIKTEYEDYSLSNDMEQVIINFVMPDSFADISIGKVVNIELLATNTYITLTTNGGEYSGSNKNADVLILPEGTDYFNNISLVYYYGALKEFTASTINAGIYEVRAQMVVNSSFVSANIPNGLFLGIQTASFTVTTKALTIKTSENWVWGEISSKEYDGTATKNLVAVTGNIEGIIAGDATGVFVYSTITWSDVNVATNLNLSVSNFTLSGSYASNYTIGNSDIITAIGIGIITAKTVTVTIASSDLTFIYNNSAPTITHITVSGSLGSVDLVYSFNLVNDLGEDITWDGVWNVGRYEISVSTSNINYNINLFSTYYLNIVPIIINSISYSGFNNLTYSGSNLAGDIKGTYSTLYSGTDYVTLTYYYYLEPLVGITTVVNAGTYEAKPAINAENINYSLSLSINTLTLSVSKATRIDSLAISTGSVIESTVGESDIALTINNSQNGEMVLNKVITSDRGELQLINTLGIYSLKMVSYGNITFTITENNSQNYVDSTSNSLTIKINPKAIYIGVANRIWYYGDDVALQLQYSWDINQTTILSTLEFNNITNFVAPSYFITADELNASANNYEVKILGAQSDGYRFYTASTKYITINKRPIEIIVATDANSKVYGANSLAINYSVKDKVNNVMFTTLPNGDDLGIVGQLARVAGENVGVYAINAGTITSESNPNYDLTFNIGGNYAITRKGIKLVMPLYSKHYLEEDPIFAPILDSGYTFVGTDNINSVNVPITRSSGSTIGSYNYILGDYDGGINYTILSIDFISSKFIITYAVPILCISSTSKVTWGNTLSTSTIYGSASHLGQNVEGTFRWTQGSLVVDKMAFIAEATFTPIDSNFRSQTTNVTVPVAKRKLSISFSGNFDYTYIGREITKNYTLAVDNYIEGKIPTVQGNLSSTPIEVGDYIITPTLTDDCGGVYELSNVDTASLRIYHAVITVTVDGGEITYGQSYIPVITYAGFVGGETESVFTTKASVGTVPTNVGYYSLTPSGAVSNNYTFTYLSSAFIIKKAEVLSETVKLTGTLAPEVTVDTTTLNSRTTEYKDVSSSIDSAVGATLLKPNKNEMVEYVKFVITGNLDSSTEYEVQVTTAIESGVTLYLINEDNSIVALTDYTVNSEGNVVFSASNIKGIGIFKQKSVFNYIIDYLPFAGIAIGIIAIITGLIYISKRSHKIENARRTRRLR